MKKSHIIIAIATGLLFAACSKFDTGLSLKQSVQESVSRINDAASAISLTKGYQLLTVSGTTAKSDIAYNDSILLYMVSGIYDYAPDTLFYPSMTMIPRRIFKKTGTSEKMIINLPQKVIFHPKYLFDFYHAPDSAYNHNNFTISAGDYHNFYSWYDKFDYRLAADFILNKQNIGSLDLTSKANRYARNYSTAFTFNEGYNINFRFQSGDTTTSSFEFSDKDGILLKETNTFIGTEYHRIGEKYYTLQVGNVEIKRGTGIDSIQVYLDGVLQKSAAARIVDSVASTGSICHHRDLLLKFDDGSTINLNTLIKPSLTTLRSLDASMRSMYFAKNIVDYIAYSVYYHNYMVNSRQ